MLVLHAWRSWRSGRSVALLAAAALAIGIGSTTAIYTVVNAVMLKPLPYRDGERFVALFAAATNDPTHYASLTFADALAYQQQTQAFDAFGWFREAGKNLMFAGEPHHIQGVAVTVPLVQQLGVQPMLGQWFDDENGVVLSQALWRRLGSDGAIVGKSLTLDGRGYHVTGVMPEVFRLPVAGVLSSRPADLWMGLAREEAGAAYFAYARRRPGITFSEAEADVKRVAAAIATADPANHAAYTARLFDLRESVVRQIRPTLWLLFAASGLLFLITCANTAGLMLARSVARARETAMRVALGARRSQLALHYFAEGLPVSLAGALAGILLSTTLTPVIVTMAADYLPRAEDVELDWTVLVFALAAAFLATALSSLAPLWQAFRTAPAEALGEGARASAGARSRRASHSLVIAEIALAFVLLAVSGVLLVHLRSLYRTAYGFDADHLMTFTLSVPGTIARESSTRVPFQRRLLDALTTIPGVDGVAFANQLPLDGCCFGAGIYPEGRSIDLDTSQRNSLMAVSPDYFRTMAIPLRRGRLLTDRDVSENLIFAVVNETAAVRYWGEADPVGAYGRFNNPAGDRFQLIGVVGDVRNDGLGNPVVPEIYIPSVIPQIESMQFVIRSGRQADTLVPEIRRTVRAVDPQQPVHDVAPMHDIIQRSMTLERTASLLTSFFAAAALVLATLGVYGVVSYGVRQRTSEIGTRMALGATRQQVLSLIVAGGLKMTTLGVVVGGAVAVVSAPQIARLFDVARPGVIPFLGSAAVLGIVAFAASFVPAWRASLLSPMVAIRDTPGSMWQDAQHKLRAVVREWSAADEPAAVPLGTLITDFASALRTVSSVPEATQAALAALRERVRADSITLLEKSPGGDYRCETCSIAPDGFLLGRLRHYPHPLSLSRADFEAWLRWAREFRPQHCAEIQRLENTGARIAVPLRAKNETVGVLLLGAPEGRERYSSTEKDTLRGAADVFALMIENARLTERALEQEKLRRDLALAAEVQRRLLPPEPPRAGAATLAAMTLPARTVGGDYYDFIDLGRGAVGVAVADVSGKGIAAALLMSVVQASLRAIAAQPITSLSQLASKMNGFLFQSTGANKYATFFYAEIDKNGRRLRYVNAGHNPPYLTRRGEGGVEICELPAGGTVLGLFPEVQHEEAEIGLRPGDLLVAFTDGVPEALNPGGEEFGEDRLKALLRDGHGGTADEIASTLAARMREWIGSAEQHDDLTFIVATITT